MEKAEFIEEPALKCNAVILAAVAEGILPTACAILMLCNGVVIKTFEKKKREIINCPFSIISAVVNGLEKQTLK